AIGIFGRGGRRVVLALQVLATRNKDQCLFHRFVVRAVARFLQGIDEKRRVGEIGPLTLALAPAAVEWIGLVEFTRRIVLVLGFGPLRRFEVLLRVLDDLVVALVRVCRDEAIHGDARLVVAIAELGGIDAAVRLHGAFEEFQAAGHKRIVRRAAVA